MLLNKMYHSDISVQLRAQINNVYPVVLTLQSLAKNRLTCKGAQYICKLVVHNTVIRTLDISGKNIGQSELQFDWLAVFP